MTSEVWREVRLGDLLKIQHGWAFKGDQCFEDLTGRPIVVNIGNFQYKGGFRFEDTKTREYRGKYPKQYELAPRDILLVMTCQTQGGEILGIPGRVPTDGRIYLHNQRLGKVLVERSDQVDGNFLYYVFLWPEFNRYMYLTASGTKILHTSPSRIEDFRFELPPLPIQRRIAEILGRLDDKIEVNRRINRTLEAMAQALYKHWFVDFGPFQDGEFVDSELGPIPRGWEVARFGDHVQAVRGLSYKGKFLSEQGAGLPLHNLNSIFEGGGYKHEGMKWYTGKYQYRHITEPGDVIVANTEQGFEFLLIGYPAMVPRRYGSVGLFSHHLYRVRPLEDSPITPLFIYHLLMTKRFRGRLIGFTNGTTVNMLPRDGLEWPELVLPPRRNIDEFDRIVAPMFSRIEANFDESQRLTETRDYLLPRLLSGKIEV